MALSSENIDNPQDIPVPKKGDDLKYAEKKYYVEPERDEGKGKVLHIRVVKMDSSEVVQIELERQIAAIQEQRGKLATELSQLEAQLDVLKA